MCNFKKIMSFSVCAVALTACAVPVGGYSSAPQQSTQSTAERMASDAAMTALCDKVRNSNDPKLKAAMAQSCAENGY